MSGLFDDWEELEGSCQVNEVPVQEGGCQVNEVPVQDGGCQVNDVPVQEGSCQVNEVPDQDGGCQANGDCQEAGPSEPSGQLDLFQAAGVELPPATTKGKSKKGSDNAKQNTKTAATSKPAPPKEPDKDLERMVVITSHNETKTYAAEMTLEEIREDIEKEYPAYSATNTTWHFEKQEDRSRYLCIPYYKSNKAG